MAKKYSYLIVLPLMPFKKAVVKELPLHCTVMPWFKMRTAPKDLLAVLQNVIAVYKPIELVSKSKAFFGERADIPVHVLEDTSLVIDMHMRLLSVLKQMEECVHISPRWIDESFCPHVTCQGTDSFAVESRIVIDTVSIVEQQLHRPDCKKLIGTIRLK